MTPKPVDTGGVEGGPNCECCKDRGGYVSRSGGRMGLWQPCPENCPMTCTELVAEHRRVEMEKASHATEKPTDSMGGEKDKDYASATASDASEEFSENADARVAVTDRHRSHLLFEGMSWPDPTDPNEVQWQLRYGKPDRADLLFAASCMSAYWQLVSDPQKIRNGKVTNIRRTMGENAATEPIGNQEPEPATEAVTPGGSEADANKPSPDAPQPEKREGRYEVGDNLTLRPLFDGVSPPIPVYERLDTHTAAIANAAYLAGQKSQPEGDERSAGEEIKRLVEVAQNGRYDHRTDTFVVKSQLLVQIKHTAKRLAALGSGEGKEQ